MNCPRCYTKLKNGQFKCHMCGFNTKLMDGATNRAAKKARHSVYKDDIMYTTQTPPDVKRKKMILLTILLGLLGAHHLYVGRICLGLYMMFTTLINILLSSLIVGFAIIDSNNTLYIVYQFALVFQGVVAIMWVVDMIKVIAKKYKFPVYCDEFSK